MTFCYAFNQENDYEGDFETREAALAAAVANNAKFVDPYTAVWTAKHGRDALGSEFLVDVAPMLLEYARDGSDGCDGEGAGPDWLETVSAGAQDDLAFVVKIAFDAWCERHGHVPRLWHVTDEVEHALERVKGAP